MKLDLYINSHSNFAAGNFMNCFTATPEDNFRFFTESMGYIYIGSTDVKIPADALEVCTEKALEEITAREQELKAALNQCDIERQNLLSLPAPTIGETI